MSLTIASQVRDRNHHIVETLPTWLKYPCDEIVIFDQPGKERAYDVVKNYLSNPRVKLIESTEKWNYSNSKGRNAVLRSVSSEFIMHLDIDVMILPGMPTLIPLQPNIFLNFINNEGGDKCLYGSFLVRKTDFDKVNGYNERCLGWGWEDEDFRLRLERAGLTRMFFPQLLKHISHGEDMRTQSYDVKHTPTSWHNNNWSCRDNPWTIKDTQVKFNSIIYQGITEERALI